MSIAEACPKADSLYGYTVAYTLRVAFGRHCSSSIVKFFIALQGWKLQASSSRPGQARAGCCRAPGWTRRPEGFKFYESWPSFQISWPVTAFSCVFFRAFVRAFPGGAQKAAQLNSTNSQTPSTIQSTKKAQLFSKRSTRKKHQKTAQTPKFPAQKKHQKNTRKQHKLPAQSRAQKKTQLFSKRSTRKSTRKQHKLPNSQHNPEHKKHNCFQKGAPKKHQKTAQTPKLPAQSRAQIWWILLFLIFLLKEAQSRAKTTPEKKQQKTAQTSTLTAQSRAQKKHNCFQKGTPEKNTRKHHKLPNSQHNPEHKKKHNCFQKGAPEIAPENSTNSQTPSTIQSTNLVDLAFPDF